MTQRDEREKLAPCPFCGSEIKHIESWAKSFNPPRLWHEWHHIEDNEEVCPIRARGKIILSATDDVEMQNAKIARWNTRAPADGEAHAEIQRLQDAKRRALAMADERAKENVALRAALESIARTSFSGSDIDEKYMQGNRDAHTVCASMARAALSNAAPASEWASEKALRGEIWCLREIVRGVRIMANTGAFSAFEGEAWLKRVRNIDLYSDPALQAPEPADTPDEGPDPLGYAKGERA